MRLYSLNIADYILRFESAGGGPDLVPSERFLRNICSDDGRDILIRVHSGTYQIPAEAKKVFDAPYIEEINGIRTKKSDEFWSIHEFRGDRYILCAHPLSAGRRRSLLKFSLSAKAWDLWIETEEKETDPLEYPLDGLVLYYLTVIYGDIMIHASGVSSNGLGYLFSGISGKGKTTMARLWESSGARVLHDDRLIVRKKGDKYIMYNTPVYNNDSPGSSVLDRIFLLKHGTGNTIIPVSGAAGISMVMANCIQHNYDGIIVKRLLDTVSDLLKAIPVAEVHFLPDRSIVERIRENEKQGA